MRTLRLAFLVASIFGIGSTTAGAASVDVIWQVSGTATTTVATSVAVTGDIVLTPTTPIVGAPSAIELSADTTGAAGEAFVTAAATVLIPGWTPVISLTIGNPHSENVVVQLESLGLALPVDAATTIGTITVNAGLLGGTVTVQNSGLADDIISGGLSVIGEYVFNAGTVVVPEPATAGLLALGLIGLAAVGRPRR